MRPVFFLVGFPLAGAAACFLLGSVFNSGTETALREEITVYTVLGAVAGLLLGITFAILGFARSVRERTDAGGQWKKHPVFQLAVVIGIIVFFVQLIIEFTIGY